MLVTIPYNIINRKYLLKSVVYLSTLGL